jgi:hypothetical protein
LPFLLKWKYVFGCQIFEDDRELCEGLVDFSCSVPRRE